MRKTDDSTLDDAQRSLIRTHARAALKKAGAFGRYPTPVADVMEAARVKVADEDALTDRFLTRLRRSAQGALRSALSKVLGVLHVAARLVYIDRSLYIVKQTFIKLHETAHAVLPWQRDIYAVTEDCEKTLAPEIGEGFEREANVFASDVLFQLDAFTEQANDSKFGILVPVHLSKRFGSSIYAAVRRYVSESHRTCIVLVLDPPVPCDGDGFAANLRRALPSPSFAHLFGHLAWPERFTPDHRIGAMIPVGGKRMSAPRTLVLTDRNGTRHECIAEAFTQKHQVFILIHETSSLTSRTIVLAK